MSILHHYILLVLHCLCALLLHVLLWGRHDVLSADRYFVFINGLSVLVSRHVIQVNLVNIGLVRTLFLGRCGRVALLLEHYLLANHIVWLPYLVLRGVSALPHLLFDGTSRRSSTGLRPIAHRVVPPDIIIRELLCIWNTILLHLPVHTLPASALALSVVVYNVAFLAQVHLLGVVSLEEIHLGRWTDTVLEVDAIGRLLHVLKLVTHLELSLLLFISEVVTATHFALLGVLAGVVLVVVVVVQASL